MRLSYVYLCLHAVLYYQGYLIMLLGWRLSVYFEHDKNCLQKSTLFDRFGCVVGEARWRDLLV